MISNVRIKQEDDLDQEVETTSRGGVCAISTKEKSATSHAFGTKPFQLATPAARKVMATLPPDAAASAAFPPGCPVMYPHEPVAAGQDVVVEFGEVQSISIDISHGSSRELLHEIQVSGNPEGSTRIVGETDLRYAPQCPVAVQNDGSVAAKAAHGIFDGVVLYIYGDPGANEYSLLLKLDEQRHVVKHGVAAERIKFRCQKKRPVVPHSDQACSDPSISQVAVDAPRKSTGSAKNRRESDARPGPTGEPLAKKLKWIPPQSSVLAVSESTSGQKTPQQNQRKPINENKDGNAVAQKSKLVQCARTNQPCGHSAMATHRTKETSVVIRTVSNDNPPSRSFLRRIDIPEWLVEQGIVGHLLRAGGQKISELRRRFDCQVSILGRSSGCTDKRFIHDNTHVRVSGIDLNSVRQAKTYVENLLIDFIGSDASLGQLLYSLAECDTRMRINAGYRSSSDAGGGAALQRSPLDLRLQVWMNVVELPKDEHGECHGRFLLGPKGSLIQEIEAKFNCDVCLHGLSHDDHLLCDPYAIITASKRESVDNAVAMVESKIRRHVGRCYCSWRFDPLK